MSKTIVVSKCGICVAESPFTWVADSAPTWVVSSAAIPVVLIAPTWVALSDWISVWESP